MDKVIQSFQRIEMLIKHINEKGFELSNGEIIIFGSITIPVNFDHSHSCFLQLVNWLYSLTVEVSSPSFDFISKKAKLGNPGTSKDVWEITKLIHALRTYHGHSLDLTNYRNVEIQNFCLGWYKSLTSKTEPQTEEEWVICIQFLLTKVISYLEALVSTLGQVLDEDEKEILLTEWISLVKRDYPAYRFETVLVNVLERYGMSGIFDTNSLTKLEIDKWRKDLRILSDGFNFEEETDRIIVKYVELQELCPVKGGDLIAMGVTKGSHIKTLMEKVRTLFYELPCKKEDLLEKIKANDMLNGWLKV